jgi:hypothetical protein
VPALLAPGSSDLAVRCGTHFWSATYQIREIRGEIRGHDT